MQSRVRPLEGAWTGEKPEQTGVCTVRASEERTRLVASTATIVRLVSKGHSYLGVRGGGAIAQCLEGHAGEFVVRPPPPSPTPQVVRR